MNYIIFDLEATCWEKKPSTHHVNEIIEIGAVKINEQQEIIDEFVQFIRPVKHPQLSPFCTQLTSITQSQVDEAATFPEVLQAFQDWIEMGETPYLLCSWGFYDRNQLEKDCKMHERASTWVTQHHISLKHQYTDLLGTKRRYGMARALAKEGFSLDGTHHRGIDDARNIAKIFLKYFGQWETGFDKDQGLITKD